MRLPGAGRRSPVLPPGKVFWLGGWVVQRSFEDFLIGFRGMTRPPWSLRAVLQPFGHRATHRLMARRAGRINDGL